MARDLRLSLGDAAGYGLMAGVAEVYLPAFGLALGMAPVTAGLVATAPMLAGGVLQLVAPRALERARSLRGFVVACMVAQALAFVPLVALAVLDLRSTPVVFAAAALYWAAGMSAAAAWNPWMARVVPRQVRGRFFGRRQGVGQASMLVGLLGAGAALHAAADRGQLLAVYAAMFALALVARLGSALMVARMGAAVDERPARRMRFRSIPPRLRGSSRASLLVYVVAALAAAALSGPFLTPYLLTHVGLDYASYAIFTAMVVVAKIVALPLVGRVIHRIGVRRVLTASALAIAPIPALWMASGELGWLLALQVYAGVAWAGFDLGVLMALFDVGDDAERTTMQSALSAAQALGTAGASLAGGAVLGALGADHDGYAAVFLLSTAARVAAMVLLVRGLPATLARLPFEAIGRVWTVAIRPWGGTIVRPFVEGLERLRGEDRGDEPGDGRGGSDRGRDAPGDHGADGADGEDGRRGGGASGGRGGADHRHPGVGSRRP